MIEKLQDFQNPETGLVPNPGQAPDNDSDPRKLPPEWQPYLVLAVGYALEVLGATFEEPIYAIEALPPEELYDHLEGLPWRTDAWHCGAWIDHYATGLYFNHRYFESERSPASVFGWLESSVDRKTGLWGEPTAEEGFLQPVNGFYRATRGTYAQFGLDVPFPKATIDTVLRHARESQSVRTGSTTACNTLDVVHPLWLCGQQTAYRHDDVVDWARTTLAEVVEHWHDGQGFAFELTTGSPTLQGPEMWLSVTYLLATVCRMGDVLGHSPKGVHRTSVGYDLHNE